MVVPTPTQAATNRATLEDLMKVEGKAELIGGRIIHFMPSGDLPTTVAADIYVSLREYVRSTGVGVAYPDGIGFAMRPPLPSARGIFTRRRLLHGSTSGKSHGLH